MPRKTTTKNSLEHPYARHAPYAPLLMVVIVALLTIGLLLIWRELPNGTRPQPSPTGDLKPVPALPASPEQAACESAKGKWVECGNPCHGMPGEICIASCEAQCLCGGTEGWMCPKEQTCTSYEPSATAQGAIGVCRLKPDEKPAVQVNVMLDRDLSHELLTSPFEVAGTVSAPNASVKWQLADANGVLLASGDLLSDDEGKFALRSFILTVPKTSTGTLEIGALKLPVRLPTATMTIKYYSGQYIDGAALDLDCSTVHEQTATVVRSSLPVETTLRYLLARNIWESEPRVSYIPRDTRLESIKVSGGTATVVLSPELQNYGGGSCNVEAIRAQIETTLKQFSSVKQVVIIEDGKTEAETLQP